jgi:hypothetical protein
MAFLLCCRAVYEALLPDDDRPRIAPLRTFQKERVLSTRQMMACLDVHSREPTYWVRCRVSRPGLVQRLFLSLRSPLAGVYFPRGSLRPGGPKEFSPRREPWDSIGVKIPPSPGRGERHVARSMGAGWGKHQQVPLASRERRPRKASICASRGNLLDKAGLVC